MPLANDPATRRHLLSTSAIQRVVWIVVVALVVVLGSFAGYYYLDRYAHPEGQSPVQSSIKDIEATIVHDPQNPEARISLAESYLRSRQPEKAIEQVEQVLQLYPDSANALLIAGIARVQMNQPEAALDPLLSFVALRREGPMARADTTLEAAYYFLGESYVKLGQPEEAIPVLEAALIISPADADALYQAGLAYQATGQFRNALERYQGAVRLVPDFAEVYQGMAETYAALDQPHHERYARGMVAFSQKDYKAALADLEYAAGTMPDFAPAFLGMGLAYERTGQLEAALSAIQRTLELSPNDFAAQQALGRIETSLKQGN